MDIRAEQFSKFLYGPYFFHGLRQAVGVIGLALLTALISGNYLLAFALGTGAICASIIDQPGGPRKYRINEMLVGTGLGTLTVLIISLASPYSIVLLIAVTILVFFFSIISIYGKRGGLIGFVSLLMMVLTMHYQRNVQEAIEHTLCTLLGGLFYIAFSVTTSRIFRLSEEQKTLSGALFSTADYIMTRANLYDTNKDLEESYRKLINKMSLMIAQQQSARDVVLKTIPNEHSQTDTSRIKLWNIFIDMVSLLDTMVASKTDYNMLRRRFEKHDILLFMRDTLFKLSRTLNRTALCLSHNKPIDYRNSVKAELKAIEFEIEQFKQQGLPKDEPEIYSLCVQILRRLRNASRLVDRLADATKEQSNVKIESALRPDTALQQFSTNQTVRLQDLRNNLTMRSPFFRYSIRVTACVAFILLISTIAEISFGNTPAIKAFLEHNYWVIMTLAIIMRPGYALTKQRTSFRLVGTIIGCLVAIILFNLTSNVYIYFIVMFIAMTLGNSFVITNYKLSTLFTTIYVLISIHLMSPGIILIIGERAFDTALACVIAYFASFFLPHWEKDEISVYANKAIDACAQYLHAVRQYVDSVQAVQELGSSANTKQSNNPLLTSKELSRKNMHSAFGAFADSFSRMMDEPKTKQVHIIEYNNLILQSDSVASQLSSVYPHLLNLTSIPPNIQKALDYIAAALNPKVETLPEMPTQLESNTAELLNLQFPLKQAIKAAQLIHQEMKTINQSNTTLSSNGQE